MFCGCGKSEENNSVAPFLEINKESLTFETEGGKETVKVSSNCDWRITGGSSWCTPSNTEGNGKASIIFTTTENSATSDLKTTFYFEFEGEFGLEFAKLDVMQKAIQVDDVATLMDDAVFISYCYENFDLNKDSKISIMEANTVKAIEMSTSNLISVKGIEVFTNLEKVSFSGCTSLQSIDLSKNSKVTTIGESAFEGCSSLTRVTIPDSITEIGKGAFSSCSALSSVYIADLAAWCQINFANYSANPLSNGAHLYLSETLVEDLVIPDGVTSIGDRAFYGCTSLTSVTIPDSVTSIGGSAFDSSTSLTSVNIGNSVTSIGDYAFRDCPSLNSVHISDLAAWCKIDFASYSANPLSNRAHLYLNETLVKDLVIDGNTSPRISAYAFYNCTSLKSVTINVSFIESGAFCSSSLTSVTLDNNVESIGEDAFEMCRSLNEVYCKKITPPKADYQDSYGWGAFTENHSKLKIYVPTASLNAYKEAKGWSEYRYSIVGYDFQ